MDKSAHWKGLSGSDADISAEIDRILDEIRASNAAMEQERAEIERLKAETRQLRDETRAILVQAGVRL